MKNDSDKDKENDATFRSGLELIPMDNPNKNIENKVINLGAPNMEQGNKEKNNYNKINNFSNIEDISRIEHQKETYSPSIFLPSQMQTNNNNNIQNQNQNRVNNNNLNNNNRNQIQQNNMNNMNINNNNINEESDNQINNQNRKNLPEKVQNKLDENRKKEIYREKNRKIQLFFNIIHIFILILTLICFQLNFSAIKGIHFSENTYFSEIINNWFSSPIIDITVKCDSEKHTKLISDYWQGTAAGCICGDNLSRGGCVRRTYLKFMCDNVPAISSMPYNLWKNTQICTERIPGGYFDMNITNSKNSCPESTRNCGVVDSQKNYLCYDKKKECPFNKFSNDLNKRNKNDKALHFKNSHLVFGNENINDKILFFMKVAFDKPCRNPFYDNLNFKVSVLNFFFDRQMCFPFSDNSVKNLVSYDDEYNLIDNYSGVDLYKENGFQEKLKKLPKFSNEEYNRNIHLYAKNYFGLKIKCFKKLKSNNNIGLMLELNDFLKVQGSLGTLVAGIIFELFLLISVTIMICIFNRKIGRIGRLQTTDMSCYIYIFCLDFLVLFLYLIIAIAAISNLTISGNVRYIFGSKECVDEYTIAMFNKFIEQVDSSKNIFMSLSILLSFKMLFWIGFVVYSFKSLNKIDFYPI